MSLAFAGNTAFAGPCDAYYSFDGNLADAGGNGYDGMMIAKGGQVAQATFVEGKSGQGLRFDGTSAMRALLDLHPELCPQVTISLWIKVESPDSRGGYLVSSSNGYGPALRVLGLDGVQLVGVANGLIERRALYTGAWIFVAIIYDHEKKLYRLHAGSRPPAEKTFDSDPRPPNSAVWLGAYGEAMHSATSGIVIDDLRIIGRILDPAQVAEIRATPGQGAMAAGNTSGPAPGAAPAGATCAAHSACPEGSYCGMDGTCHPNSQLPMASGDGTTLADLQQQFQEQNANSDFDIDYESPTDILTGDPLGGSDADEGGTSLSDLQESFQEQNANSDFDIDYESPTDILTGDPFEGYSADEDGGTGSGGTGSGGIGNVAGGIGEMTVLDYLRSLKFDREPSGNVRDCTSFTEVVRDLATTVRDEIANFAATNACAAVTMKVHETVAGQNMVDPDQYETAAFAKEVLNEVYDRCVANTVGASQLPDKLVGFWNSITGSDTWATIGPRILEVGVTKSGNLVSPGDRKFLTPGPMFGQNRAFLVLKELDGRARVTARVCTVSPFNEYRRLYAFTVNETPEERQDQQQYIGYQLDDVGGQFLIVYLDAAGLLGRNFKYELTVD